jgi:hypothetical protein
VLRPYNCGGAVRHRGWVGLKHSQEWLCYLMESAGL